MLRRHNLEEIYTSKNQGEELSQEQEVAKVLKGYFCSYKIIAETEDA